MTKNHIARLKYFGPLLALGLLVAVALLSPFGGVAEAQFEVKFIGTVVSINALIGGTTWTVEVDEVISGPPLSGQVDVGLALYPGCLGSADPDIAEGDAVEVYGYYIEGQVDLCPSADYYIRKVSITPTPTNTPTATATPTATSTAIATGTPTATPTSTVTYQVYLPLLAKSHSV